MSIETSLTLAPDGAPWLLVPFTRDAGVQAPFRLTLRTDGPLTIREVTSPSALFDVWAHAQARAEAHGEWCGTTAGGPMAASVDKWAMNPQFALDWEHSSGEL